jgi:hypothetical protein
MDLLLGAILFYIGLVIVVRSARKLREIKETGKKK